jgi:hypothetical protein
LPNVTVKVVPSLPTTRRGVHAVTDVEDRRRSARVAEISEQRRDGIVSLADHAGTRLEDASLLAAISSRVSPGTRRDRCRST